MPSISLVIPIRNEEDSIEKLIESIKLQTLQPDEVIFVDGGSTDRTVELVERFGKENPRVKLLKIERATPGRGRNIGIEAARNEWIALTDAGITLDEKWLEELVRPVRDDDKFDVVYGNLSPVIGNFFDKCVSIAHAPPKKVDDIRTTFIASSMVKKEVWRAVGGFPDLRAAEDLMFMESIVAAGFAVGIAPKAVVHWDLQPDLPSTFRKFVLYSRHNVWAGRQWDWHYGVARQYLTVLPFALLGLFYSWWWLLIIPLWLVLRTAKRIFRNRFEFGLMSLFNPAVFFGVMFLSLVIDLATYIGWAQAVLTKK